MKTSKQKKAIIIIAVLLAFVIAAVVWLSVAAVKDTNPVCLFKHHYGEDGVCTRCGQEKPADKPVEQPNPEPDEPQAAAFAAASLLATSTADSGLEPLLQDGSDDSYMAGADIKSTLLDNDLSDIKPFSGSKPYSQIVINMSTPTKSIVELSKDSEFKVGSLDNTVGYSARILIRKSGQQNWQYVGANTMKPGDIWQVSQFPITEYGIYEIATVFCGNPAYPNPDRYPCFSSSIVTVRYGVTELPSAPSKTGYTFTGWYTDDACTQLYTEEYVTSDITLYAGFQPITYTLNFLAQGGTGTMQQMQCTYDVEYTLPTCGFTYPNYRFVGWAIDDDSDEATVGLTNGQKFSNLSEEDNCVIDLFAKWELDTVTVSFDINGTITSTTVVIGQSATLPTEPSKTGCIFVGWYTENNELYNNEAITEDCTLTARFEIIRCTVTFMVDGEVYAHYVCDYGTSISEALKASEVNTVLYKVDSENF